MCVYVNLCKSAFTFLCALCVFFVSIEVSVCVCVYFEVKPKLPQQAEASPPGSVH